MFKRVIYYFLGLFILALGVVINTRTMLGTAALNTIPYVVSLNTPLSMGTVIIFLYTLFVIIECIILRKLDIKIILQLLVSIVFGKIVDFINTYIITCNASNIYIGLIMLAIAINLVAIGMTIVIKQDLANNPPDGIVKVISDSYNISFGKVKLGFDIVIVILALICSLLLTGSIISIGLGTILSAMFTGYFCGFYRKLII